MPAEDTTFVKSERKLWPGRQMPLKKMQKTKLLLSRTPQIHLHLDGTIFNGLRNLAQYKATTVDVNERTTCNKDVVNVYYTDSEIV